MDKINFARIPSKEKLLQDPSVVRWSSLLSRPYTSRIIDSVILEVKKLASEDKDIDGMFAELMPRVSQVIATRSYHPRAMEPDNLVDCARRFGKPVKVVPAVEDALEEALRLAGGEALVLVTGSIFIAAGARDTWYNRSAAVQNGAANAGN